MAMTKVNPSSGSIQAAMSGLGASFPPAATVAGQPRSVTAPQKSAASAGPQPLIKPSFGARGGQRKKPISDTELAKQKVRGTAGGAGQSSIGNILSKVFQRGVFPSKALNSFRNSKSKSPTYKLMMKFFKPQKRNAQTLIDLLTKWSIAGPAEGTLFSMSYNYKFDEGSESYRRRGDNAPPDWFKNASSFRKQMISLYADYLDSLDNIINDWDDNTQVIVGGLFIYLPLTFVIMRGNYAMLGLLQAGKLEKASQDKLEGFKNTLTRQKMTRFFDGLTAMLLQWDKAKIPVSRLKRMFTLMVYYLTIHNLKE